jgi:hypothetical protein
LIPGAEDRSGHGQPEHAGRGNKEATAILRARVVGAIDAGILGKTVWIFFSHDLVVELVILDSRRDS